MRNVRRKKSLRDNDMLIKNKKENAEEKRKTFVFINNDVLFSVAFFSSSLHPFWWGRLWCFDVVKHITRKTRKENGKTLWAFDWQIYDSFYVYFSVMKTAMVWDVVEKLNFLFKIAIELFPSFGTRVLFSRLSEEGCLGMPKRAEICRWKGWQNF